MDNKLFRKKTIDRISSPEQLTDYLKVTNPGIWLILIAVVLILAGFLAWASVGTLTTTVDATAQIDSKAAYIVVTGNNSIKDVQTGMRVIVDTEEYVISNVDTDDLGRTVAHATIDLPDGKYNCKIVVEEIHPIVFLMEGR